VSEEDLRALTTEQTRPELSDLDLLSVEQLVSLMCADVRRVPDAVDAAGEQIVRAVDAVVGALDRGGRLIYVGAGTAGRIGMLDAAEAEPTFNAPRGQVIGVLAGGRAAFEVPVENAEDDRDVGATAMADLGVGPDDAVVGITASGRTPYVLGAVEFARRAGAVTVGVVCNERTPLADLAEMSIEALVGPEIVTGSTRLNAGTAQKVVLNIISTAAMIQLGKTYGGLMVDLRATNEKLRDRAIRIVVGIAGVSPERARAALEQCEWRPKRAAAMLVGDTDPAAARLTLERHDGRLRPALEELGAARAPGPGPGTRRIGVSAALVDGTIVAGDVAVVDGRIAAIALSGGRGGLAIPALVDAQVNGYAGIDVFAASPDELDALSVALLYDGVGAYQPTLITGAETDLLAALRRLADAIERQPPGARITGVHLEGPFLSPERSGVHPPEHLRDSDPALLERLLDAGPVRTVTIAPELPGALELIELSVARGVAVWLGHSQADAAQACRAFKAGATAVTHLFNAMVPMSARQPGLAGAALATSGIAIQLIGDGVHVSDELLRVAFAAAPGRCSLVTDAVEAAGLRDGAYRLGRVEIESEDGVSRRADGVLAGGTSSLADGLVRLGALGIDAADAAAAVTERPARLLGGGFGRLEPGGPADLLVVDEELRVREVLSVGRRLEETAP
jgi:N-acetylmuramic acid 6-phosphate etherase/N-acetylglucosamine-6-phosphate deacetylase